MLRQNYIDRICTETLSGRFGVKVTSPASHTEFKVPSASAGPVTINRNTAVWTTAVSGVEQGKL